MSCAVHDEQEKVGLRPYHPQNLLRTWNYSQQARLNMPSTMCVRFLP